MVQGAQIPITVSDHISRRDIYTPKVQIKHDQRYAFDAETAKLASQMRVVEKDNVMKRGKLSCHETAEVTCHEKGEVIMS